MSTFMAKPAEIQRKYFFTPSHVTPVKNCFPKRMYFI